MTQEKPMIDPKVDLKGATPELLAKALLKYHFYRSELSSPLQATRFL